MATSIDKGKTGREDQSDLLGESPFGTIGPGRSSEEASRNIVGKLKKKRGSVAGGSTWESKETANVGDAISRVMKK